MTGMFGCPVLRVGSILMVPAWRLLVMGTEIATSKFSLRLGTCSKMIMMIHQPVGQVLFQRVLFLAFARKMENLDGQRIVLLAKPPPKRSGEPICREVFHQAMFMEVVLRRESLTMRTVPCLKDMKVLSSPANPLNGRFFVMFQNLMGQGTNWNGKFL